jgi:hypothetical protein
MSLLWFLVTNPGLFFIPGAFGACFRILAWPPSRKRFDDAVNNKY